MIDAPTLAMRLEDNAGIGHTQPVAMAAAIRAALADDCVIEEISR